MGELAGFCFGSPSNRCRSRRRVVRRIVSRQCRWAAGPPGAHLTMEASAALKRLEKTRNAGARTRWSNSPVPFSGRSPSASTRVRLPSPLSRRQRSSRKRLVLGARAGLPRGYFARPKYRPCPENDLRRPVPDGRIQTRAGRASPQPNARARDKKAARIEALTLKLIFDRLRPWHLQGSRDRTAH
jgi:hypothetical protein